MIKKKIALAVAIGLLPMAALAATAPATEEAEAPAEGTRTLEDGVFTEEQAERGKPVFDTSCGICHGGNMRGTPGAPGLIGPRFTINWGGETVGAYFTYVKEFMPAGNPGTLTDAQYADVISYIFQTGGFPAGEEELPTDVEVLDTILVPD